MKTVAVAALAAALSFHASAEEKPLDKADAKLSAVQKSVKSGAKKLESETNKSLESGRKSGRKVGKNLEKGANDAAKSLREKVPSVRSALSISFTCGSIPRSSTSHPTISAEP